MKAIIELNGRKHIMTCDQAAEIIRLVHTYGREVFEHKRSWSTKVDSYHVYEVTPAELGIMSLPMLSDELYGMGKLAGKAED
jgi:hypothetical protein